MAGAGSNQRINLSWTDNSSNETNFVIERSTAASFNVAFQTIKVGPNTRSYVDQNVQRRTTYYYRVKAITTGVPDNNAYSNTASATTR